MDRNTFLFAVELFNLAPEIPLERIKNTTDLEQFTIWHHYIREYHIGLLGVWKHSAPWDSNHTVIFLSFKEALEELL